MLAELALLSSAQPHPAYAATCSAVQPMLTLEHFEAALERARQHNRLVVIKFYQVSLSTRPPPQTTAPDHSPTAATGPSHPHTAPRRAATLSLTLTTGARARARARARTRRAARPA